MPRTAIERERHAEKLIITVNAKPKKEVLHEMDSFQVMLRYGNGPSQYIDARGPTMRRALGIALDAYEFHLTKHQG